MVEVVSQAEGVSVDVVVSDSTAMAMWSFGFFFQCTCLLTCCFGGLITSSILYVNHLHLLGRAVRIFLCEYSSLCHCRHRSLSF
jgi:hypothetical protein